MPALASARNPIDAFIRARLAKEGLQPSPAADRRTLLRRVTLDLTGLAPERYRGRYSGLWMLMWSLGMLLGPWIGTLIFQRNPAMQSFRAA